MIEHIDMGDELEKLNVRMEREQKKGDCYEANATWLIDYALTVGADRRELKKWRLCHGTVLGAEGSVVEGKWFDHCWLEMEGKFLIDFSNGKKIVLPIEKLSHRIKLAEAVRYTPAQAIVMLHKTSHYGPWTEEERQ